MSTTARRRGVLQIGVLLVSGLVTASLLFGASSGTASPSRHAVSCGATVTGNVTLTSDLNCTGVGLRVGADNVVIDLNGHTIKGDGSDNQTGVLNEGFDHVTIENGAVANYWDGVAIWYGNSGTGQALYNVVRNVTVRNAVDKGIQINGAPHCRVLSNSVFHTKNGTDISLWNHSDHCLVSGNTVVGAGAYGIALSSSIGSRVLRNLVGPSHGSGIELSGSRNTVAKNKVFENQGTGILASGNHNTFSKNIVSGNDYGFNLGPGTGVIVDGNTVSGNSDTGISVQSSAPHKGTYQVTNNVASGNAGNGISISDAASSALLQGNTTNGNDSSGIYNYLAGTTIGNNTANGNADWGIKSVPGAIDTGGNKAKLNGKYPTECVHVTCT